MLLVALGVVIGLFMGGVGGFLVGHATRNAKVTVNGGSGSFTPATDPKPPSVQSSREDPVPLDTPVDLGNGWRLTVGSFDASPSIESQEPPAGRQFVTVELAATYVDGDKEATSPFFGMDLSFVGPSGVASTASNGTCFAPDPSFDNLGEVYKGATVRGNYCIAVPVGDVDGLLLVAEPGMSFDATKTYFALR